jgi:hypothetical protein
MFYISFTHNTDLGGDFRTTTMQEGQWQREVASIIIKTKYTLFIEFRRKKMVKLFLETFLER